MDNLEQFRDFSHGRAAIRKKSIVLVDDDLDLITLNKTILELEDFEVHTALSGETALSLFDDILMPDLIVLDFQLEDMSGPEFLMKLEEHRPEVVENVPVVFLSGMDLVPRTRAVGHILKPAEIETFLASIHRYIELRP